MPGAAQLLDAHLSAVSAGVGLTPVLETTEQLPWLDPANWVVEPAGRQKVKNADLAQGFTDAQIAALWKHLGSTDYTNPAALLSLTGCGGEIGRPAPGSTATAGRDVLLRAYFTTGNYTGADDPHLKWIRTMYRDVFAATGGVPVPNGQTAGTYINYPDVDLADPAWNTSGVPWSTLYYRDNYARLQRVKRRYDPRNLFHHALSIDGGA
ncbi:BBE domain-containing protein [Dactylosporangium cerinum]